MTEPSNYDDILVPTDGSDTVQASTGHALQIGRAADARIHALYVIDRRITMSATEDARDELKESLREEGEDAVAAVAERAAAAGLDTKKTIRGGTPSKEILDYAAEEGVDLIVIGSSGKSPREKLMTMGSVSESVVDNAHQPVLIVKRASEERDDGGD